jgi:hypothetical protein
MVFAFGLNAKLQRWRREREKNEEKDNAEAESSRKFAEKRRSGARAAA